MNLDDIPLFSVLKSRLGYLNTRQRLIAQNVANADTPGYTPSDLKPFTVPASIGAASGGPPGGAMGGVLALTPVQTEAGHFPGSSSGPGQTWRPDTGADSETKVDGNKVVLEDQMMKMTDSRMNYDAAINFYEKSMSMLEMAIKSPGK